MKVLRFAGASLLVGVLAGCSNLPAAGPTKTVIAEQGDPQAQAEAGKTADFEIVPVTAQVVTVLEDRPDASLLSSFGDNRPSPDLRIGVGDMVQVNVWDAQSLAGSSATTVVVQGGRLAPSTLPEQMVSRDGTITVPFAGEVKVRGKTIEGAQAAIREKLGQTLQEPQVLLSLSKSTSNAVTVVSESGGSGRVPLTLGGDRLLDLLAKTQGMQAPLFQTAIQLTRNGRTQLVPALKVIRDPKENIYLQPGDIVSVMKRAPKFVALGATGTNREVTFEDERTTLAQALGKVGGLDDYRADPEGVFVFRFEPKSIATRLDPHNALAQGATALVPVVYQINMRDVNSFFLAQNFPIYDRDILYVSNAPLTELQKFLTLIQLFTQPVLTGASVRNSIVN